MARMVVAQITEGVSEVPSRLTRSGCVAVALWLAGACANISRDEALAGKSCSPSGACSGGYVCVNLICVLPGAADSDASGGSAGGVSSGGAAGSIASGGVAGSVSTGGALTGGVGGGVGGATGGSSTEEAGVPDATLPDASPDAAVPDASDGGQNVSRVDVVACGTEQNAFNCARGEVCCFPTDGQTPVCAETLNDCADCGGFCSYEGIRSACDGPEDCDDGEYCCHEDDGTEETRECTSTCFVWEGDDHCSAEDDSMCGSGGCAESGWPNAEYSYCVN